MKLKDQFMWIKKGKTCPEFYYGNSLLADIDGEIYKLQAVSIKSIKRQQLLEILEIASNASNDEQLQIALKEKKLNGFFGWDAITPLTIVKLKAYELESAIEEFEQIAESIEICA